MIKIINIIFFLFLFSCSSENENNTSEIELSGEKVEIMNPSTGIDTAAGKISQLLDINCLMMKFMSLILKTIQQ